LVISALVEDSESELAVPKKLNSYKANLNRSRKRPRAELAAGTLIENSDNKPIMRRRRLVKGRHNLSTYKPILVNNSSTGEITVDNSKLL
jgi:hypothetical protein